MRRCLSVQLRPGKRLCLFFFFNDTATTEIYTLSLHDALPISPLTLRFAPWGPRPRCRLEDGRALLSASSRRSEEHTSELQSPDHLVCRLLLEKKKKHDQQKQKNAPTGTLFVRGRAISERDGPL